MSFPLNSHEAELLGADAALVAWEPQPVCWATLDDAAADAALNALGGWVSWVTRRYALDQRIVPPCWHRHGALVEELSALRTGWQAAYSPTAPGNAPLDWQAMFAAARHRLQEWVARTGCRANEHREDHLPA